MGGFTEQEIRVLRLTTTFTSDTGDVPAETVRVERRGWLATVDALRAEVERFKDERDTAVRVANDAVAGLRYIERVYGRHGGVGWDRVYDAHAALRAGEGGEV